MSGDSTTAQKKASDNYLAKHDLYRLVMPAGTRDLLNAHTAVTKESINAFINRAIAETIENDRKKAEVQ